jgi:succinyl-diaminopimelate desuccinylase
LFTELSDEELGQRLAARTLELIDIPSESGSEDAIAAHITGVLGARDAGDTCILTTTTGPPGAPLILLAGHLDTVPAQGNIPGSQAAQAVLGLGAADMKASLAVMIEVGLALDASATARVGLCFFGREELPVAESALTPLLAREPALRDAALVLVMEPTANELHAGCLGNINATWTFSGRSGHSARPWQADNAIEHAARAIKGLTDVARPVEHVFDGLTFTEVTTVTQIAGGIAQNVIPDTVRCHVNHRYAPGTTPAEAEARLTELCAAPASKLDITSNAPSGAVCVSDELVQKLIGAGDLAVAPKQAWTPVAEFTAAGISAVNFGPGDPRHAHQRDEQVDVAALVRSARTLDAFLTS